MLVFVRNGLVSAPRLLANLGARGDQMGEEFEWREAQSWTLSLPARRLSCAADGRCTTCVDVRANRPTRRAALLVRGAGARRCQFADPRTGVAPGVTRSRNVRSRCRCSMCPAIHINSRSWLRSSSTHEPSDPPHRVVNISVFVTFSVPGQSAWDVAR